MTLIAVVAALLAYMAAAVVHVRGTAHPEDLADELVVEPDIPMQARIAVGVGVLLHGGALVATAVLSQTVPGFAESLSSVSLGVMVAYVFVARDRLAPLGRFLLPMGVALLLLSLAVPSPKVAALESSDASMWLPVHLGLVFAGVVAFCLEFLVGGVQWWVQRRLKAKRFVGLERFPSLEVLDRVQVRSLLFGLLCLGLGVLAGGVWASSTMHHAAWVDNPKVWSSAVIWCWYAGSLAIRQTSGFHGRWSRVLSLLGFVGLLFSMFGLDFITGGFHAYGR